MRELLARRGLGSDTGGHAMGAPRISWANRLSKGWKHLLHYSNGQLTEAALPGGPDKITVGTVALFPGTTQVLGGGDTHAPANPGTGVVGVILPYEP